MTWSTKRTSRQAKYLTDPPATTTTELYNRHHLSEQPASRLRHLRHWNSLTAVLMRSLTTLSDPPLPRWRDQ